jgi:hypothetical protein
VGIWKERKGGIFVEKGGDGVIDNEEADERY